MRTIFVTIFTTLGPYGGPVTTGARTDAGIRRAALAQLGCGAPGMCGGSIVRVSW